MNKILYTPHTEAVDKYLTEYILNRLKIFDNYKILHLTPTLILKNKRASGYSKHLKIKRRKDRVGNIISNLKDYIKLDEFHHWTRELVYDFNMDKPISKNESHILVKRAINEIFPEHREWLYASNTLLELFLYLQTTTLTTNTLKDISLYTDWKNVLEVYDRYIQLLNDEEVEDYSKCLLRLIKETAAISNYNEVIFDGPFLFFDPIHEAVINRCKQQNIPVTFIVPFDKEENSVNPAYRVIQKTYSQFVPENEWIKIKSHRSQSNYLERLPSVLFTNEQTSYDNSLSIYRYPTLEQELLNVVTQIKKQIKQGYTSAKKVVIVTPNSRQVRPLVREISENIGLDVEVPERPILGLTVGEFVKLIYDIKTNERKYYKETYLNTSMFRRILCSKWFAGVENTINRLQAIEEVFLKNVLSIDEWEERLIQLLDIKNTLINEELQYHPLHLVDENTINCWLTILRDVKEVQKEVFSLGYVTIAEHAQRLQDSLIKLAKKNGSVLKDDDNGNNYMDRIISVLQGINSQNRIKIGPDEFGNQLYNLLLEQEDYVEGEETENSKQNTSKGILVTSLENIAYQEYNYIYIIQFTQDNYPYSIKNQWPLHTDILWKLIRCTTRLKLNSAYDLELLYSDRERYYFYLSFLSSKIGNLISYSKYESGEPKYPSLYLNDIAHTFGILNDNTIIGNNLETHLETEKILQDKNFSSDDITKGYNQVDEVLESEETLLPTKFSIEEIALYRLCPRRFQYNALYRDYNIYKNSFQLSYYLASELYQRSIKSLISSLIGTTRLVEVFENNSLKSKILSQVPDILEKETKLFSLFPVNEEVKKNSIYYAEVFLNNFINYQLFDSKVTVGMIKSGKAHATVNIEFVNKIEELIINTDKSSYSIFAERELSTKLGSKVKTYSLTHTSHFLNSSTYEVQVVNGEKFYDWLLRIKREIFYDSEKSKVEYEIKEIITSIEESRFEKNRGSHCSYCPFQKVCMDREYFLDEKIDEQIEEEVGH